MSDAIYASFVGCASYILRLSRRDHQVQILQFPSAGTDFPAAALRRCQNLSGPSEQLLHLQIAADVAVRIIARRSASARTGRRTRPPARECAQRDNIVGVSLLSFSVGLRIRSVSA